LVAAALLAGYASVTFSLARLIYRTNPTTGRMLAPYDGRITAALAASLANDGATVEDRSRADDLSRLALRQDPTAIFALSTLGLNSEVRSDIVLARRYFSGAQWLSRRNLPTQLWSIEDAVRRNDISGALHQYDITLRVMPNLWEMLFPVLASANTDIDIRSELVKTLSNRPAWGPFFLEYLAGNSSDPRATVQLFAALQRSGQSVPPGTQAVAVNKLIDRGLFDDAWAYYATVRRGADRSRSRNPDFAMAVQDASQFDWQPVEANGAVAILQGGLFDFSVPANSGGIILQQMQLLPSGTYRLEGRSANFDPAHDAQSYWVLSCRNGREIGRVPLVKSQEANGLFAGTLVVGPDCPVQILALVARPSEAADRLTGQIDQARLVPAG